MKNNELVVNIQNIFNQACQLHQEGKILDAMELYLQILPKQQENDQLLYLLGTAFYQLGDAKQSINLLQQSIGLNSKNSAALNNLGLALQDLKRLDESLACYNKSIVLKSDFAEAFYNRGNVLNELKKLDEAVASYNHAIVLKPDYAEAFINRGNALKELKLLDEALASYDKAIGVEPDYAEAYYNRGVSLQELKRLDEALESYDRAITLKPDYDFLDGTMIHTVMHLCDWQHFDEKLQVLIGKIKNNYKATTPFPLLAMVDTPEIHKEVSKVFVKEKFIASSIKTQFVDCKKALKIRVGYYSADFHNHATMHLMAEMLENHDKENFEIIAFSFGSLTNDAFESRSKNTFDQFIECQKKSDAEIAQLSRELGIDIAVDLKGFTQDARAGIFANFPAPIQVNFLGYPGTMGAEYIDYIIADDVLVPLDSRAFYTEKVAYLPDCYQPNCRIRDISSKLMTRSDLGLPENGIVFSSFNSNYKITPSIFASWMRILKAVDGSVLWLLATNVTAQMNLRKYACEIGVDPDRLIFAKMVPVEDNINRMLLADLMLDTFPYGAHTTCSEALRMGLPVITKMGQSFASRVAASLLTTVGLPELITESMQSYENLAIELATNAKKLLEIRARLAENIKTSPLFDPIRFARNLESIYRKMYQRRLDGLPPDHIRL